MNLLFTKGPSELYRNGIFTFLTLREIVRLDNAVLNNASRMGYLDTVAGFIYKATLDASHEAMRWFTMRGCFPAKLRLTEETTAEALKVMAETELSAQLQMIVLAGCEAVNTLEMTQFLQRCDQVTEVELKNVHNDELVAVLKPEQIRSTLQVLRITEGGRISDSEVTALVTNCPRLHTLDIAASELTTEASVYAIAGNCPQLLTLRLNCENDISDNAIIALTENCKQLRELTLATGTELTDVAVVALAENCPKLIDLQLYGCMGLTSAGVHAIAQHCHQLRILDVGSIHSLTDAAMVAIAHNCTQLTNLYLVSCFDLTDTAIVAVAQHCPLLECLSLTCCPYVTEVSVQALKDNCPKLSKLTLPIIKRGGFAGFF